MRSEITYLFWLSYIVSCPVLGRMLAWHSSFEHWTGKQHSSTKEFRFSFFIVFHRLTVVWQRGLPRKFADCVFVPINSVLWNLLCVWCCTESFYVFSVFSVFSSLLKKPEDSFNPIVHSSFLLTVLEGVSGGVYYLEQRMSLWWSILYLLACQESHPRWLRSLLLCLCDVFPALIISLVCWFCTSALNLVLVQIFIFLFFYICIFLP